ncbi:hypothetical protein L1987_09547 [Smallanthus sonchifolius]|uniref:Uncharacterized protein n=1 Tax=Smallanthus sonchifolius TaxID=185202 RepID=A0ACB9JPD4_9ASTR|nr:hypothetical protein L1987_09547 [Smallanthus sonchifolius]
MRKKYLIKETGEDEIKEDNMKGEGEKMGEGEAKEIHNEGEAEDENITPGKNIMVLAEVEEKKQERPKRKIILADALCSPYKQRQVVMEEKMTNVEKNISTYLFLGNGFVWDSLFLISNVIETPRTEFETLTQCVT